MPRRTAGRVAIVSSQAAALALGDGVARAVRPEARGNVCPREAAISAIDSRVRRDRRFATIGVHHAKETISLCAETLDH